jgi:6-pyruvoyltetrahydropterin/6-carboxytetrahydropterin synthase
MTVESTFSAAHALRGYQGPCCRVHGHNYRVVVHLAGAELDALGMLVDFTIVKAALAQILDPLDHQYLNEVPPFTEINATSEALARHLYTQLKTLLGANSELCARGVRVTEVDVYESDKQGVGYGED